MHNIDRTYREAEWETDLFRENEAAYEGAVANVGEVGDEYAFAYEDEAEGEGEYEAEYEAEYEDEYEDEYENVYETYASLTGEMADEATALFNEAEELALAAELLEVADEAEMDHFLGKLSNKAQRKIRRTLKPKVRHTLFRGLKGLARKALPIAGSAIGTIFGGPLGGTIGGKLAGGAGKLFGLELEGLSMEDQEFAVARRYVQLAGEANRAATLEAEHTPAQLVAKRAVAKAVKKYAPGLIPGKAPLRHLPVPHQNVARGQWQRQGRHVILYNVYP